MSIASGGIAAASLGLLTSLYEGTISVTASVCSGAKSSGAGECVYAAGVAAIGSGLLVFSQSFQLAVRSEQRS